MTTGEDYESRRQRAIDYCKESIDFYDKGKNRNRRGLYLTQVLTIALSAVTPILILISNLPEVIKAIPAALAAVTAAVGSIFHLQDDYVRFSQAFMVLTTELLEFETKSTPQYAATVDPEIALSNFVTRVNEVVLAEVNNFSKIRLEQEQL